MNIKGRITGIIRFLSLVFMILMAYPLAGQQSVSPPVIKIISPSPADSLNNTGIVTVSAEIVSEIPLQAFRIIHNSGTVVDETVMKPEKKDDKTYLIKSFVPLGRGLNSVSVEARNSGGTAFSETRIINSHLEPFITWLSPAEDNANFESGVVPVKVEIKTASPLLSLNVSLNGIESVRETAGAVPAGDNTFHFEKRIQLRPGRNSVFLTADNGKGATRSVTRIINSGVPPVIILKSPLAQDSINNSGLVTVIVEIKSSSPLQTYRIYHNGILFLDEKKMTPDQKDSTTSVLGINLPLKRGLNTVYVEAKNALGTTTSEKRTINSRGEPFVTWLEPGFDNIDAKSGIMMIRAEIKTIFPLQNLRINVNGSLSDNERSGITQLNNDTYFFEKSLELKPGRNSIYISAGNTKGVIRSTSRTINFGSAPVITLVSPSSKDSLNTSGLCLVEAEVISYVPLQSFRIINYPDTKVSEAMMKPEQKDSITYIIRSNTELKKGLNTIYVEAKNVLGTGSSNKQIIYSQSEPIITWLSPESATSETESGTVTIKAEIRSYLDLQKVDLILNGIPLPGEEGELKRVNNETYAFERTLSNVLTTRNGVLILAANLRGTTTSQTRNIYYSSGKKPVITIAKTDSLNNSGIVLFNTEIASTTRIQAIRVIHNGTVLVGESAKIPEQRDSVTYVLNSLIPLKAGLNTFYVEAKNSIGTSSSDKLNIFCQPEPIINWISPASIASTEGTNTLKIKAEIITSFDLVSTSVNNNGTLLAENKEGLTRVDNNKYILEQNVPLKAGDNNIILTAANARGIGYSPQRNVNYVPGIISEIVWITPVSISSETRRSEFPLSASIKTKSEIRGLHLNLNGAEIESGGMSKTTKKSNQEYLYENRLSLKPGFNTVEFSAITDQGTIIAEKRTINYTVPVAPVLAWIDPSGIQSEVTQASVDISLKIKSDEELENLKVFLNGKPLDKVTLQNSVSKEGDEFILGSSLKLNPGENIVYVAASNIAGAANSETRNIKYIEPVKPAVPEPVTIAAPAAPVVAWLSPSRSPISINLPSAEIKATVKSSENLQSLMIYINGVGSEEISKVTPTEVTGEYLLKKTVIMQPGDNTIYFTATNSIGTIRSEDRLLNNPPAKKPLITWATPSDPKTVVNSDMIIVEACIESSTVLREAQVYVNGIQFASETVFSAPQPGNCNYRFMKPVLLKEGDNTVIINALNAAGSEMSERRIIRFQTGISERRLALVMGNSDYANTLTLKNPVNDANLIEATLKTLDFEVIKRLNATKDEMEQAIREFSENLPEYNVALFYYAGHGIQVGGENYLIPTGAKLDKESDVQWEAVGVNTIVRQFEQVPENVNIIILDACRDNPFKSWSRGAPQGFKMLNTVSGTFVAFATSENSTAADGLGVHGVYSEELVKQMLVPQSISGVFNNTRRQVMQRTNNRQVPTESSKLVGDFYFKR